MISVDARFHANLHLAKEEQPSLPLPAQIALAAEWTLDELTSIVARLAERAKWQHIEAVNLAFYS